MTPGFPPIVRLETDPFLSDSSQCPLDDPSAWRPGEQAWENSHSMPNTLSSEKEWTAQAAFLVIGSPYTYYRSLHSETLVIHAEHEE